MERWDRVRVSCAWGQAGAMVRKQMPTLDTAPPHSSCDLGKALSTPCILSLTPPKHADGRMEVPDSKGVSCRVETCGLDPTVPFLQRPPWPYREETKLGKAQGCGQAEQQRRAKDGALLGPSPSGQASPHRSGVNSTDWEARCIQQREDLSHSE